MQLRFRCGNSRDDSAGITVRLCVFVLVAHVVFGVVVFAPFCRLFDCRHQQGAGWCAVSLPRPFAPLCCIGGSSYKTGCYSCMSPPRAVLFIWFPSPSFLFPPLCLLLLFPDVLVVHSFACTFLF